MVRKAKRQSTPVASNWVGGVGKVLILKYATCFPHTFQLMDQPLQPVQPTYIAAGEQEKTTLKSTQPADTMYQPLSKEFMSSPSTYAEMKHLQSTHPAQSMQHAPNADTMYQPLSKEFMSPPSTYAEMKHLQSTQPVQSMQHAPNADTMYQPLSKEFMSSPTTNVDVEFKQVVSL